MPRSKNAVPSHRRRKKILAMAKGYYGGKSKLIRTAKEAVDKSLSYSYRDRKKRKGDFRRLWIARINAATRQNGLSYSRFMDNLKKSNIDLDRKVLAHIAFTDPVTFQKIVQKTQV
ncbi:50S ribosomal protein L20 [candidate division KSB1 bacterium]|nr:50S ribosomal protein L20 [candidate division KSB1 bacterium]